VVTDFLLKGPDPDHDPGSLARSGIFKNSPEKSRMQANYNRNSI
jgi:hypothetical protein